MWPFFVLAYGTFSVARFMDFKSRAYKMTDEEYKEFYASLGNSVSRRRLTDLNESSIQFIISNIPPGDGLSVLDVGAGNGYLLRRLASEHPWRRIVGVDVVKSHEASSAFELHSGALPKLPFDDGEFDVVTCTHVIEHLLDVELSVKELLRVARKRIFIVLPRQRYFHYTLDEHVNFYPQIDPLLRLFGQNSIHCTIIDGDWAFWVDIER